MNDRAHAHFIRWANWTLQPVAPDSLGYGVSIESKIAEGMGEILPGRPRCGGPKLIDSDPIAIVVEQFLRGNKNVTRVERRFVRTYYLVRHLSVDEKAARLRMPVRTMYWTLDKIHEKFIYFLAQA